MCVCVIIFVAVGKDCKGLVASPLAHPLAYIAAEHHTGTCPGLHLVYTWASYQASCLAAQVHTQAEQVQLQVSLLLERKLLPRTVKRKYVEMKRNEINSLVSIKRERERERGRR